MDNLLLTANPNTHRQTNGFCMNLKNQLCKFCNTDSEVRSGCLQTKYTGVMFCKYLLLNQFVQCCM